MSTIAGHDTMIFRNSYLSFKRAHRIAAADHCKNGTMPVSGVISEILAEGTETAFPCRMHYSFHGSHEQSKGLRLSCRRCGLCY